MIVNGIEAAGHRIRQASCHRLKKEQTMKNLLKRIGTAAVGAAVMCSVVAAYGSGTAVNPMQRNIVSANAADSLTIEDFPQEYKYAADWIWENRILKEQSTSRCNTIFDQIVAGKGTLNYVVRWQSYKTITYEQRKQFEQLVSDSINGWAKWLSGYENWPYDHIEVKIVGWAVIDKNCLLDLHDDEIVYTDTEFYDSQYDTSNGYETIPDKLPNAPSELSRFDHFADSSYQYPGGLDKRFDMYLWATQGFPQIGGCGGDWGQRLSDDAYLNMLDGTGLHVLEHELGHGFGMTDFYGGEGASDGFPPGGFPGGENSLMMAGSAAKITDFDGWMLRYMWSKIKDESGRFVIEKPVVTTVATTTSTTVTTTTATQIPAEQVISDSFIDEIVETGDGYVSFDKHGAFYYDESHYGGDESKNLAHYEVGDKINISMEYMKYSKKIVSVHSLTLVENVRGVTGDVNSDGQLSIGDLVMLSQWLLNSGDMTDPLKGDLDKDDKIDVYDLVLMRQLLVEQQK